MITIKSKIKKYIFLILSITVITSVFSLDFADTLAAWKERGYAITSKGDYKVVEFKFNNDNIATLDEKAQELIIYTYTGNKTDKPTENYLSDIRKVFYNSAVDVTITEEIIQLLSASDYTIGSEKTVSNNYKLKTTAYNNNSIILQFNHHIPATDISNQIDSEENKQLKIQVEELEKEISALKELNKKLTEENQSKTNTIERLEKKTSTLEASLDKYQNLSDYKEAITENLQKTVERYKEIEKQKQEEIDLKNTIIDDLNQNILEIKLIGEQKEHELNTSIEELANRIKALETELKMSQEIVDHYKSRLYTINSLYNLKLSESDLSVPGPATVVENISQKKVEEQISLPPVKTVYAEPEKPVEEKESPVNTEELTKPSTPIIKEIKEETEENDVKREKRLSNMKVYENSQLSYQIIYQHDADGKCIKEDIVFPTGQVIQSTKSKYYENGALYEKGVYQNDILIRKTNFQYNKEGNISRSFLYSASDMIGYQVYQYDNTISEKHPVIINHYENNQLKMIEKNSFDKNGNMIRTELRDIQDKLLNFTVFETRGSLVIKSTHYNGMEKEHIITNQYDNDENLICQEVSDLVNQANIKIEFNYD